ncbi:MAG: AAA family ATPase, partial [Bacteroidota bacterium]
MLKKIVIIGPESTGKTTLCQELAEYFETIW